VTGPAARGPALDRWLFPSPLQARQSRGHVTPACAGRVFKARARRDARACPGGLFELILPIWLFTKGFASHHVEP
jgi:hypothetical protein